MASLQPHASVQGNTSQTQSSSEAPQEQPRSITSDDARAVLVEPEIAIAATNTSDHATSTRAKPTLRRQDTDLRKCWICFADESEDTTETSEWRSPCPCALVAHEECLLDWIADMESPSARKRALGPPQILCPQCKTEIRLARPWNPIVEVARLVDRLLAKCVTPAALFVALATLKEAAVLHGMHTIVAIFGVDDARRILGPYLQYQLLDGWDVRGRAEELIHHWRLHFGLPLITPVLFLSRLTLADSVLPIIPIVFFATSSDTYSNTLSNPVEWPPSASLALAVLPYVRGMYNNYYNHFWAPHMRRWLKDIQPRTSQADDQAGDVNNDDNIGIAGAGDADGAVPAEGDGVFEIRVEGNLWDDWGENDAEPVEEPPQAVQRAEQQQQLDNEAAIDALVDAGNEDQGHGEAALPRAPDMDEPPLPDPDVGPDIRLDPPGFVDEPRHRPAAAEQPGPQPAADPPNRERRLAISTSGLGEKIIGALLFPSIASISGELLRLCLPWSWTTKPVTYRLGMRSTSKATGVLQEKWGRSIVGGCLFVVIKDAVMLYVRWKMAQQHQKRRVLDFHGKSVRSRRA